MTEILKTLKFLDVTWLHVAVAVDKQLKTQAARIAELESALRDVLPYVDTYNSSHREAQAKGYAALEGGDRQP